MRTGRVRGWVSVAVAAGLLLGACEPMMRLEVEAARLHAGVPAVEVSQYLEEAGRQNAAEMCGAGAAVPAGDPMVEYAGETAVAIDELVGSATLDPGLPEEKRGIAAVDGIWQQWRADPSVVDERWDEYAVGEQTCADGELYMTLLLRENPTMPATGRYSSRIYTAAQVTRHVGLEYGTAVNYQGQTIDLLLDVWTPPPGGEAERPLIVYVHGGGFSTGSRNGFATGAVEYARRGFVVASIDYRVRPNDTPEEQLAAATDAVDDAIESIRWLKANAATYGVDPDRIVMLGSSAGGATVMGVGHAADPTPGGPLAAYDADVRAVVSTGAHLTPGLDVIDFEATDAPTMMFHYEQDTSKGMATWDYAYQTCTAIRIGGPPCDFVKQPGSGHGVSLIPTGPWWTPEIGPFLWHHLGLGG